MILFGLAWLAVIALIIFFLKGGKGCTGNCGQGRFPCDCKKETE